jgi:hypothetical protein
MKVIVRARGGKSGQCVISRDIASKTGDTLGNQLSTCFMHRKGENGREIALSTDPRSETWIASLFYISGI